MLSDLKRSLARRHLTDPAYGFLLEPDESGELVSLACATSSFDLARAVLHQVAAVPIRGNRVLTSQALCLDLAACGPEAQDPAPAMHRLLHFLGARPLVGYYLDFTVDVLDRHIRPLIGIGLPNPRIDVSSLFYERRLRIAVRATVDLRFETLARELGLPERGAPDPFNDATLAALMYLRLQLSASQR